jgi:hypothetical protein
MGPQLLELSAGDSSLQWSSDDFSDLISSDESLCDAPPRRGRRRRMRDDSTQTVGDAFELSPTPMSSELVTPERSKLDTADSVDRIRGIEARQRTANRDVSDSTTPRSSDAVTRVSRFSSKQTISDSETPESYALPSTSESVGQVNRISSDPGTRNSSGRPRKAASRRVSRIAK